MWASISLGASPLSPGTQQTVPLAAVAHNPECPFAGVNRAKVSANAHQRSG